MMLQSHHNLLTDVNAQTFVPFVPSMFHFTEHRQVLDFVMFFGLLCMYVPLFHKIYTPLPSLKHTLQCKPCGGCKVETLSEGAY